MFASAAGIGAEVVAHGGVSVTDVLGSVLMVVVPVGVGMFAGTRRQLVQALQDRAEQAEAERRLRDEQARSAERTRIAREMHDLLAHEVSLIAIHAGALEVSADAGRDRVVEVAGLIRSTAHTALTDLRTVLGVLRSTGADEPVEVDDPFADLAGLVTSWQASGADVTLVDEAGPLPQDLSRTVHRIVREALTNAAKHAAGQPVNVAISRDRRSGPGRGTEPADGGAPDASDHPAVALPGNGFGLVGLAERCRLAGGSSGQWAPGRRRVAGGGRTAAIGDVMIRVLLVDDEALVRVGIRMIIESGPELEVVGEAADGADAVDAVRRHRPDVVLMDVRMPRLDGVAATAAVRALDHPPAVIVLTTFDTDDYIFRALESGAAGFLLKDTPPQELVRAVVAVHHGDAMLAPSVARRVVAQLADGSRHQRQREAAGRLDVLTPREREVLIEVGQGLSNAEIGHRLFLSEATVKSHVGHLFDKLGTTNRVQIALLAYRAGLAR